ncbi:MAG: hypothetical protein JXB07_04395 [Anaerolineae bacterium]|nr:hypothetical protein [Anaerolineae bacterium]
MLIDPNPKTVDKELLHDALQVLGEWLDEIAYQIDERGALDAEATAEWQASRQRANDVFERLSRAAQVEPTIAYHLPKGD